MAKGSASSFGAVHLRDICHKMETAARKGILLEDSSIIADLKNENDRVKAELELQLNGDI